jgi:CHAT domain-containing protein/tetratricopeptide (TPR) repeat protein
LCALLSVLIPPALRASTSTPPKGAATLRAPDALGVKNSQTVAAQSDIIALTLGKSHRLDITRGQRRVFVVTLNVGEFAEVTVEQLGIDVVVAVSKPDRSPVIEFDSPVGVTGRELVSLTADAQGEYRLEVRPSEEWAAAGSFDIKLEAVRTPTPADEKRSEAERAYAEGRRLSTAAATREAAVEKLKEAYKLWVEAEGLAGAEVASGLGQANVLQHLGRTYRLLNDVKNAAEYYERAYRQRLKIGDRQGAAYTLNDTGTVYRVGGFKQKALEYFQQALDLFREVGNRRGEAGALNNIGFVHYELEHAEESLKFYELALSIRRAERDQRGEANTLNNMAGVYNALGDSGKVSELVTQAAQAFREVGDRATWAVTLNNLGKLFDDWGEWQKALVNYESALAVYRGLPEAARERSLGKEAYTLDNMGMTYAALGQTDRALEVLKESLSIREQVKDHDGMSNTKAVIGYVYFLSGDPETALEFYRAALPCYEKAQNPRGQSFMLTSMGLAYAAPAQTPRTPEDPRPPKLVQSLDVQVAVCGKPGEEPSLSGRANKYEKALGYYERALQLQKRAENRQGQAMTLDMMGEAYVLLGDPRRAMESFSEGLQLCRFVRDRNWEAVTLHNMARLERDRGNLMEARKWSAAALDIVESLRGNVISPQLRISYFATKHNYYELDIDVNMRLYKLHPSEGYDAAALRSSESARSRALVELLSEAKVNIREGVEPGLLKREELLGRRLNNKAALQTGLLDDKHTEAKAAKLAQEITQLTNEYADVQAQIKAQSPGYAALTHPRPLDLKEMQQLLDDDTLLLEYALGSERSYVWVVSRRELKSYELPKREVIEAAAERLYESLTALQQLPDDTPQKRRARVDKAAKQYPSQAEYLGRVLLGEAAGALGNKRLLVVADGALQYIPFAALPSPAPPKSDERSARAGKPPGAQKSVPLIVEHEIVALPSASTLAALRSEAGKRQSLPGAVAVLADPVFDGSDGRLLEAKKGPPAAGNGGSEGRSPGATVEQLSRAGFILRRLRQTAEEAKAIRDAAAPQEVLVALGFDASRRTLLSPELKRYRIIHFATHGVLDNDHPELSGIALSQLDERGQAQDGMLRLHDIYNLRLPAELAVLSACDTGLGKDIRGEGLVGLTRGFMYAGVPRVVASMWKVDDYPTSLLMESFYRHMFKEKLSPAAALRRAQLEMIEGGRWNNPYYWAAFMLHGEASNMQ